MGIERKVINIQESLDGVIVKYGHIYFPNKDEREMGELPNNTINQLRFAAKKDALAFAGAFFQSLPEGSQEEASPLETRYNEPERQLTIKDVMPKNGAPETIEQVVNEHVEEVKTNSELTEIFPDADHSDSEPKLVDADFAEVGKEQTDGEPTEVAKEININDIEGAI